MNSTPRNDCESSTEFSDEEIHLNNLNKKNFPLFFNLIHYLPSEIPIHLRPLAKKCLWSRVIWIVYSIVNMITILFHIKFGFQTIMGIVHMLIAFYCGPKFYLEFYRSLLINRISSYAKICGFFTLIYLMWLCAGYQSMGSYALSTMIDVIVWDECEKPLVNVLIFFVSFLSVINLTAFYNVFIGCLSNAEEN